MNYFYKCPKCGQEYISTGVGYGTIRCADCGAYIPVVSPVGDGEKENIMERWRAEKEPHACEPNLYGPAENHTGQRTKVDIVTEREEKKREGLLERARR